MKEIQMGAPNLGPLKGMRVLDLSRLLAGNFLSYHLADLGAEVIKIEDARQPDPLRKFTNNGVDATWKVLARNKKSLALDYTRCDKGRQLLLDLVRGADALIENFKPGGMEKFGLGPELLHEINPKLVIARVSGWGQDGPYSHKPGFGTLVEAFSGFAAKSGFPDGDPLLPNLGLADMITGITGAFSLLAALREVEVRGGNGQVIDLALLDGIVSFLGADPAVCQATGRPIPRTGNKGEVAAPRNLYLSKDGRYIALSASMQSMVDRLFRAIGREDLIDNPNFKTNEDRIRNSDELDVIIGNFIGERSAEECLAFFEAQGITAGPLYNAMEILEDTHVQERGVYVKVNDPDMGTVPMPNIAARFSGTPGAIRSLAPAYGQDTKLLMKEIGLTDGDIQALEQEQVIVCGK
ncbi:CoA transferase [Pseudomaricurvus alkylphenolicus]|uniref:CaiB/BaiF CoA transferase family protein n=1 Tax=Pseudomaricurvus alkylphenolicus TaxID=1306991 RepID=UPI00141F001E|nr:CoA transferase [Pseudomaricurvus alkylphenolicus]NIB40519.1 CoA transferase [Pseudomaricurvus alkylphenolicus]